LVVVLYVRQLTKERLDPMQWKVQMKAIVKRVETVDYNIEAKTGDEARAKVLELFNTCPQSNESQNIMGLDLIDFEQVSEA
tara:strand:+ start:2310 stop:2552 length:243 start_codon:yes stop_codon:yes gene_type:complete